ncbi:MAG: 2-succinyl-5-enolpyruvyl-6-hydroxy-3-cyclohexene-1-carboxylate synthase [Bacteroidia bacterium]|nr:2-succinyl-5-enolpyruvyl-6-hydroxy-3-cyclohexene-1-carboxylate synthase [Bacteroidia bacterium]NNK27314.1 2-succinyl-5-enolpyruvyl-6-hydroxy-3-cyclohexene-1-carboxylate synthase [Flavobacteriaceae bacterium]
MKIPKIPLAQSIILFCKAKGIKHIVISPGSRSAPLTIGFTHDPFFECYSIVDERCAAFFALGIAQEVKHPVALVCTSGSALLNFFPAISEAYYSDIPLVVLSADRPKYLVGIGDGQTIDQENVYGNHVLYSANLKLDIDLEGKDLINKKEDPKIFKKMENSLERFLDLQLSVQRANEKEINKAMNISVASSGPVHINCPFEEPLYETIDDYSIKINSEEHLDSDELVSDKEINEFARRWNESKKRMILVGVNTPNDLDRELLNRFAADKNTIVFTETTSNLHHDDYFPCIDKVIAPLDQEGFLELQPDMLLTFGGMIVSKKIKAFLRGYQPKHHWHIDAKKANDTFFCLNKHLKMLPNEFFSSVLPLVIPSETEYFHKWENVKKQREEKHNKYLKSIPFCDLKVFDMLLPSLPKKANLHLGNSSTVRYAQLFNMDRSLKVYCNRGTSGIDGSTSTAIGCASSSKEQTILITGDLSFLYDSNALWNNYIPNDFRIIIINNGGGGIFRILPGHKNSGNFDTYFETTHELNAESLCKMYGFEYLRASNENELNESLLEFYILADVPKILEVFTPRVINDEVLLKYFDYIK